MANNTKTPATRMKQIAETQISKIANMEKGKEIVFPDSYNWQNAIQAAKAQIAQMEDKNGTPILQKVTEISVHQAIFDMVVQGLNPVKKQCYFVPYKDKLTLQKSYFGTIAALKRFSGVADVQGQVVWKGDEFDHAIENGRTSILKHKPSLENVSGKMEDIVAAYSVIFFDDGSKRVEIMSMGQIRASWDMRRGNGLTPAHQKFPDQMAIKTVINRNAKYVVNTSDDKEHLAAAFNNDTEYLQSEEYSVEETEKNKEAEKTIEKQATEDFQPKPAPEKEKKQKKEEPAKQEKQQKKETAKKSEPETYDGQIPF